MINIKEGDTVQRVGAIREKVRVTKFPEFDYGGVVMQQIIVDGANLQVSRFLADALRNGDPQYRDLVESYIKILEQEVGTRELSEQTYLLSIIQSSYDEDIRSKLIKQVLLRRLGGQEDLDIPLESVRKEFKESTYKPLYNHIGLQRDAIKAVRSTLRTSPERSLGTLRKLEEECKILLDGAVGYERYLSM